MSGFAQNYSFWMSKNDRNYSSSGYRRIVNAVDVLWLLIHVGIEIYLYGDALIWSKNAISIKTDRGGIGFYAVCPFLHHICTIEEFITKGSAISISSARVNKKGSDKKYNL